MMPITFRMRLFLCLPILLSTFALAAEDEKITPCVPECVRIQGVEMAPVQPLCELLGIEYSGAHATLGKHDIQFGTGSIIATANDSWITLPHVPFMLFDVQYIPVAPVIQALGGSVTLSENFKTLTIHMPGRAADLSLPVISMSPIIPVVDGKETEEAFVDADVELYEIHHNGDSLHRLTFNSLDENIVAVSPNGQQLLYLRNGVLYLRNVNSPNERIVAGDPTKDDIGHNPRAAEFSPDGSKILLSRNMTFPESSKYSLLTIASGQVLPLKTKNGIYKDWHLMDAASYSSAHFSPDGDTIVCCQGVENTGFGDTYYTAVLWVSLMHADGSGLHQVAEGWDPSYSPDGSKLLFYSAQTVKDHQYCRITTYQLTGENAGKRFETALDDTPRHEREGRFSPDGKQIVFRREGEGLWTMHADRSHARKLTDDPDDCQPSFMPDGKSIVFLRRGTLYTIPPDGNAVNASPVNSGGNTDVLYITGYLCMPDNQRLLFHARPATKQEYGGRAGGEDVPRGYRRVGGHGLTVEEPNKAGAGQ